jgi:hypothetical protein
MNLFKAIGQMPQPKKIDSIKIDPLMFTIWPNKIKMNEKKSQHVVLV